MDSMRTSPPLTSRHASRHARPRRASWAAPVTLKAGGVLLALAGLGATGVSPVAGALTGTAPAPQGSAPSAAVAVAAPRPAAPVAGPAGLLAFTVVPKPAPAARGTQAASRDTRRPGLDRVGAQGGGDLQLNRHDFTGTGISGLTYDARRVFVSVMNNFPQITSVIGVRPDSIPDHPSGRAVDFMIPGWDGSGRAIGDAIVDHVQAHAGTWNVDYVIWRQRIWTPGSGWKAMSDRGSPTANHYDHVHVSVR